ncbi:hypothetical protein AVEN_20990-1 [Araneus ventricosus]|uniref:Uncharacterized protein n=1 Tax=Araneus ventricosus TaxID=182803 RepID=A0A4Y2D7T4_ARAVE|nr:hypothetical protein AVEN_20990-1 [Araneus ventricosus]
MKYGSKRILKVTQETRHLPDGIKRIVVPAIEIKAFLCHKEKMSLAMTVYGSHHIRDFGLEEVPEEAVVNKIVSLATIRGLEVDSNGIDELVEEHNQELTTEKLMELHCVSQQEVMEESLS